MGGSWRLMRPGSRARLPRAVAATRALATPVCGAWDAERAGTGLGYKPFQKP